MTDAQKVERWIDRFPLLQALSPAHLQIARGTVHFPVLDAGAIAYELDGECAKLPDVPGRPHAHLPDVRGRARGADLQGRPRRHLCPDHAVLLSGGTFPAQSVAEEKTELAACRVGTFQHLMGESAAFRSFVMGRLHAADVRPVHADR